jgi:hypothetical protein
LKRSEFDIGIDLLQVALGQAFLVPAVVLVRTAQETDAVALDPLLMDHRALSSRALALESEHIKPNAALAAKKTGL